MDAGGGAVSPGALDDAAGGLAAAVTSERLYQFILQTIAGLRV